MICGNINNLNLRAGQIICKEAKVKFVHCWFVVGRTWGKDHKNRTGNFTHLAMKSTHI